MAGRLDFNRIKAGFATGVILAVAGALAPATATATLTDTYVNDTGSSDSNDCSLGSPCLTIGHATGQTSPGGTVHIDGGTYNLTFTAFVGGGRRLLGDDFTSADGTTTPIVNGGTFTAVGTNSGGGTIQNLTLKSDNLFVVRLDDPVTVIGNTLSATTAATTPLIMVGVFPAASGAVITGNTFNGAAGVTQTGIDSDGAVVTVSNNTFNNAASGVFAHDSGATGGNATITGNSVHGSVLPIESGPGGRATISGNLVDLPPASPGPGIYVSGTGGSPSAATATTVAGNRVIGAFQFGIEAEDSPGPVTLDSNLVTGATAFGVFAKDNPPDETQGDISASNLTLNGNDTDFAASKANLTVDSSVATDLNAVVVTAPGTCTFTFSRGPMSATGCTGFQTGPAPDFVSGTNFGLSDTPANRADYIDRGNPAASPFTLDAAGLARLIDADGACPLNPVRDLGAYEFQVPQPSCAGAPSPTPSPPSPQPAASGPTGLRTAALKKCKKKHGQARAKCKKKAKLLPL
jgi:parallel beta helix pectate lyase-like protein